MLMLKVADAMDTKSRRFCYFPLFKLELVLSPKGNLNLEMSLIKVERSNEDWKNKSRTVCSQHPPTHLTDSIIKREKEISFERAT